jgi:protein-tyrosine-phosphatase
MSQSHEARLHNCPHAKRYGLALGRRRFLASGMAILANPALATASPCRPPQVLFVCPAGTVKSAIARETLKRRAAERGVAVRVASRGVHLEDHVSPGLAARLAADGIDPHAEPIRALAPTDPAGVDVVVAFDEAAQAPGLDHARVWDIPSWNSDYDHAKATLAVQVEALLDELQARRCGG